MNIKRMRGRNHRSGGGGGAVARSQSPQLYGNIPLNRNHVFDSNGPESADSRTAQQLFEKYLQLVAMRPVRAIASMAESYFQHAEHYFRIVNAINQATQPAAQQTHYQGGPAPQQNASGHYNGQRRQGEESQEDDQQGSYGEQPSVEPREIPIAATPEG